MPTPPRRDDWLLPTLEAILSPERLRRLRDAVRESYWEACVGGGHATESALLDALAARFRMPVADLSAVSPRARDLVPEALARRYRVLPLAASDAVLDVATADPQDLDGERALAFATGRTVRVSLASPSRILERIDEVYRPESAVQRILDGVAGGYDVQEISEVDEEVHGGLADGALERPVMQLVDHILAEAIAARASDVHVEMEERGVAVRFRIDGVLRQTMSLPKGVGGPLVSRVKIMAKLDIADRLRPQDGRARVAVNGSPVDLRISTLPSAHGEKVVVRILDQRATVLSLDVLGMHAGERARVEHLLASREGLVLVTGPTGSGKTTTLYSMLREVQRRGVNVVTVEDPVEYRLPGIVQVQVHEKAGLTFAAALRSILRQDPDVILVGEIRDRETAEIAVQAALTGHLVFSTLHTIDSAGAVARLGDLGVESFKLAAALKGVIAQRLMRRLCAACRTAASAVPPPVEAALAAGSVALGPRGCGECASTGYRGRLAVTEVLVVDAEVERRIAAGEPVDRVTDAARSAGMRSLWEAGVAHVAAGATSAEELLRVVEAPAALPGEAVAPGDDVALAARAPAPTVSEEHLRAAGAEAPEGVPDWPGAVGSSSGYVAEARRAGVVLLVSGDPDVACAARAALEPAGYAVAEASPDGSVAADVARIAPVALLIDSRNSGGAGLALLNRLRGHRETWALPALVLADAADDATQVRALAYRATDVIAGTLRPPVLQARLHSLIRRV
jgi:type II secretory ATPase GspE/PulE/Tfp pilus assembly ATPase PilB-like protein/CheY-like chemotaxis protein